MLTLLPWSLRTFLLCLPNINLGLNHRLFNFFYNMYLICYQKHQSTSALMYDWETEAHKHNMSTLIIHSQSPDKHIYTPTHPHTHTAYHSAAIMEVMLVFVGMGTEVQACSDARKGTSFFEPQPTVRCYFLTYTLQKTMEYTIARKHVYYIYGICMYMFACIAFLCSGQWNRQRTYSWLS